jgi:AcrR family transcriptional regulator
MTKSTLQIVPTTARGEARREILLRAALQTFSERGFAEATTREIAERGGVSEAALFRYFATKQELFQAVTNEFGPRKLLLACFDVPDIGGVRPGEEASVLRASESQSHDTERCTPVRKVLNEVLTNYLDTFWEHRACLKMLVRETWRDERARAELRGQFNECQQRLAELLERAAERGEARRESPEAATEIIAAAIAGFQFRVLRVEPEDWDAARGRFLRHLLTIVWDGIGST